MRYEAIFAALAGVLLTAALPVAASAQTNPSAMQIIDQLKPTGTLDNTTRGIKLLPAGPASAAPESAGSGMKMEAAAQVPGGIKIEQPSANLDIDFEPGSATLTPQATAALDQLGQALTSAQLAAYNFKIVGHTDTTGDAASNQTLSEQRAAAVKTYLQTKFSVADGRLQSEGVGESDLLVATPPDTSEQRNRRVEVINLGQ